jgi:hypothetical protein
MHLVGSKCNWTKMHGIHGIKILHIKLRLKTELTREGNVFIEETGSYQTSSKEPPKVPVHQPL